MKVLTTAEIRKEEERADRIGVSRLLLMENAGRFVAETAMRLYDPLLRPRVVAVCGLGNNGGDSMTAARHLASNADVFIVLLGDPGKLKTDEARRQWKIIEGYDIKRSCAITRDDIIALQGEFRKADIIIDGIFGTGIRPPLEEPFRTAIDLINQSQALIIAVDVPSGLDPDSGKNLGGVVKADVTVSFYGLKPGLLERPSVAGKVLIGQIGTPISAV